MTAMPRDESGRHFAAHPKPAHWEALEHSPALSRALFQLATHSNDIHHVEVDAAGQMLVSYTNGAGVRRVAIYHPSGAVKSRRDVT